jgi:folate-binding protein YgfZ
VRQSDSAYNGLYFGSHTHVQYSNPGKMKAIEFIQNNGAQAGENWLNFSETPADFPSLEAITTTSFLQHMALVEITSNNNETFLQGQLTCDVRETSVSQWRYGAHCTPKGRIIANFLLAAKDDNQHIIQLPANNTAALITSLQKYAPFYKGECKEVTDNHLQLGVSGPDAGMIVKTLFGLAPEAGASHVVEAGMILGLENNRYQLWLLPDQAEPIWQQLVEQTRCTGPEWWQLQDIRSGLAWVEHDTCEEWTPHMLNLHKTGAISFTKGCYTGQEIVARTEYKGKQKKALFHMGGRGAKPGCGDIVREETTNIGQVVNACPSARDQWKSLIQDQPWIRFKLNPRWS